MNKINHSDKQQEPQHFETSINGYVPNETAAAGVLQTTRKMRKEIFSFEGRHLKRHKHDSGRRFGNYQDPAMLTRRQMEMIRFIADGYSTRNIAELLRISPKTVEKHRQSLMKKLDIHNIAALTRYAVSTGIVAWNLGAPQVLATIGVNYSLKASV